MTRRQLGGIIAAIPTPFDANEDLALDALAADIRRWNDTRLDGYTVLGTTGEFVSLTTDEKKRVLERARSVIPEEKTMVAGTGEESTRATAELCRWAGEIGCDYAIVVTPHYLRIAFSSDSLPDHFHRVADASSIPVVVYHIPACTGVDLAPERVAAIAEHPNIAGIKDSSGDIYALQQMRHLCPESFSVLTGAAQVLHAALTVGADGAILAEACSAYDLCVDLADACAAGELERSRALQRRLQAFNHVLIGKYGVPGVKALLEKTGFYRGPCRSPLTSVSAQAAAELVAAFEAATHETLLS
ncbi:MAG: dihydrodipicolinate synthase family protein [Acidobacteriota bacterium]|nr:MAG: dihydrodipicolinate synthase family protein [Acidobacteriota bacterium]